jgi:hypothetical protein
MDPKNDRRLLVARVSAELGTAIRSQVRGRWEGMRTAERNEPGRHVWRFRTSEAGDERFLHVEHRAMVKGSDPAGRLMKRLEDERWLDRLRNGPETSLLLSRTGRVAAYEA